MKRRPPRFTPLYSSAASDVYKRQAHGHRLLQFPHVLGAGVVELECAHAPIPNDEGSDYGGVTGAVQIRATDIPAAIEGWDIARAAGFCGCFGLNPGSGLVMVLSLAHEREYLFCVRDGYGIKLQLGEDEVRDLFGRFLSQAVPEMGEGFDDDVQDSLGLYRLLFGDVPEGIPSQANPDHYAQCGGDNKGDQRDLSPQGSGNSQVKDGHHESCLNHGQENTHCERFPDLSKKLSGPSQCFPPHRLPLPASLVPPRITRVSWDCDVYEGL